ILIRFISHNLIYRQAYMNNISEDRTVVCLQRARRKRLMMSLSEVWRQNLPPPSTGYPSLIFCYPELTATKGRDLLFKQLDREAHRASQFLVIQDVGYDRGGLYIDYDEIGRSSEDAD